MKCNVLLYCVVYSTGEEDVGVELGKGSKIMSDLASTSAVFCYCCVCGIGFCPTGNLIKCGMNLESYMKVVTTCKYKILLTPPILGLY